ncbi:MAG: DNA-directed RNA polymerase subunit D [Candidatus ainarchaeum sp.]|nr:DNA-directed RNA polymerase subunit D [Candidatus ainarchaeum sp.]
MDIKKIYEEGNVTKYLVKGTNVAFMNSIRRTVLSNIPCLAIDEVTFYENDSPIFDEMLANRLGLLPIKTDLKNYKEGESVKLVLEKEGPGIVTSKDIKCTDPKIEILDQKIYLTKLGENKRIKLEMNAIMKTGAEHAKHQPAIISYNEVPSIDNNKTHKNVTELMKEIPKGTVELKAGKLFLTDPYNIKIHDQPTNILEKYGVEVIYNDNEFVLTIETTGQLTKEEIIKSALEVLNNKLEELTKEIKKV